jgi:hypothetical protein
MTTRRTYTRARAHLLARFERFGLLSYVYKAGLLELELLS